MKTIKQLSTFAFIALFTFTLSACSDDNAEEAGEKIDDMTQNAKDSMKDAGDKIDEMATDAGNAIEDKCEELKEETDMKDTDC